MRAPLPLLLPALLLPVIFGLLGFFPATAEWASSTAVLSLPYVAFGLALALGFAFTQSRVAYLAATMAAATYLITQSFFVLHDAARCRAIVLLSASLLPCLTALLYRLGERGVWTARGARRTVMASFAATMLWLVPMISPFKASVLASQAALISPMSPFVPIPALGLAAFLGSLPFLLVRKEHESALLGGFLCLAGLFFMAGLNFNSTLWRPAQSQTALALFMSAAAVTLIVAVLESAWRHANVDELTDLPGRRPLKHRFRCLGEEYAIAILDLDHFKRINDRYGHDVGDQVLRMVASSVQHAASGTTYRYGGEEFVIVSENRDYAEFVAELDELRNLISRREFYLREPDRPARKPKKAPRRKDTKPRTLLLTVSIGVARKGSRYATPQAVLEAADRALYRAKEDGRNQVCKVLS